MSDVVHVASGDQVTVQEILGFVAATQVPTVVHNIIGSGQPDFTVAPSGPRTGRWQFLMLDQKDGTTLINLLKRPGIFAVTNADIAVALMTFFVTGTLTYTLDDQTRLRVVVEADYTEVT